MSSEPELHPEAVAVRERYARRTANELYSALRPEVVRSTQEWQRELLRVLAAHCRHSGADLQQLRLLDVGCGFGGHLLDFLRIGFAPGNLTGLELLPERAAAARQRLPSAVRVHQGDASMAGVDEASQDIVFQSVVFSSLLDDSFQSALARQMWGWLRPGGWVLWYDFVYGNPKNPDVRGMPLKRVRALFPGGRVKYRRVTLAPPISRAVCRIHPSLYGVFNALPWLRSHAFAWVQKPSAAQSR